MSELQPGWLDRQFKSAAEDVKNWPDWMRNALKKESAMNDKTLEKIALAIHGCAEFSPAPVTVADVRYLLERIEKLERRNKRAIAETMTAWQEASDAIGRAGRADSLLRATGPADPASLLAWEQKVLELQDEIERLRAQLNAPMSPQIQRFPQVL